MPAAGTPVAVRTAAAAVIAPVGSGVAVRTTVLAVAPTVMVVRPLAAVKAVSPAKSTVTTCEPGVRWAASSSTDPEPSVAMATLRSTTFDPMLTVATAVVGSGAPSATSRKLTSTPEPNDSDVSAA